MQIQVLHPGNDIPNGSHLALDTCVFFDAYKFPEKFQDFFSLLKDKKITLTSTKLVYFEFSRGFDTLREFRKAEEGFNTIVDFVYPIRNLEDQMEQIKLIYRKEGKDVDVSDMSLAALLLRYRSGFYVMTRNYKHFLTELFDVQTYIPILRTNDVQTYCCYKFSEAKYIKRLQNLEKTL